MLAAMTHPSRVLDLDMKAKLCMPKSYIYIYIYIYIYMYVRTYVCMYVYLNGIWTHDLCDTSEGNGLILTTA